MTEYNIRELYDLVSRKDSERDTTEAYMKQCILLEIEFVYKNDSISIFFILCQWLTIIINENQFFDRGLFD
jgi:hypothetical protein